jgi:hypothetical protein
MYSLIYMLQPIRRACGTVTSEFERKKEETNKRSLGSITAIVTITSDSRPRRMLLIPLHFIVHCLGTAGRKDLLIKKYKNSGS